MVGVIFRQAMLQYRLRDAIYQVWMDGGMEYVWIMTYLSVRVTDALLIQSIPTVFFACVSISARA